MADPAAAVQVANPDLTAAVVQIASMGSHYIVGGGMAHGLEIVKQLPWVAKKWARYSKRGKMIRASLLAFAASLGITGIFHFDPTKGILTATIGGLTATSVGQHTWSFAQSWLFQQKWYVDSIQPKQITGVPQAPPVPGVPAPPPPAPVVVEPVAH